MARRGAWLVWLFVGFAAGAFATALHSGASAVSGYRGPAGEPGFMLRNGVLQGWEVTRDDETLVCRDPVVFIRARQVQCE